MSRTSSSCRWDTALSCDCKFVIPCRSWPSRGVRSGSGTIDVPCASRSIFLSSLEVEEEPITRPIVNEIEWEMCGERSGWIQGEKTKKNCRRYSSGGESRSVAGLGDPKRCGIRLASFISERRGIIAVAEGKGRLSKRGGNCSGLHHRNARSHGSNHPLISGGPK